MTGPALVRQRNVSRGLKEDDSDVFRSPTRDGTEPAAATGQPWADELASHVETFLAIARFVDTTERPGPSS